MHWLEPVKIITVKNIHYDIAVDKIDGTISKKKYKAKKKKKLKMLLNYLLIIALSSIKFPRKYTI